MRFVNTTIAILIATVSILSMAMLSDTALAQQAPTTTESWNNDTITTITVTGRQQSITSTHSTSATRTLTAVETIPQSIQTLTRTLIEEQELQNISSALVNISGVTPTSTMQAVLQPPIIRGFSVNYYFDGMPTYQLPAGAADTATLINVERVEVAKGPTNSLYGGGAGAPLSGIINLVSRDPTGSLSADLAVRSGSFDTLGGELDVNVPLGESVAVRFSAMTESADSHIDVINSDRVAVFPSLSWDISSDTRLVLRGRFNRLEQQEYAGIPYDLLFPNRLIDAFVYAGAEDAERTEVENTQFGGTLTHRLSNRLLLNIAANRYEGKFEEWASFPYGQIAGTVYNFGTGFLPSDTQESSFVATLQAQFPNQTISQQWLLGLDYDQTDYFGAMYLDAAWAQLDYSAPNPVVAFGDKPPFFFDQSDDLTTTALFAQNQISAGDRLDITLGLRWTELSINSNAFGVIAKDTDNSLTPRIGATYKLLEGLSLFAGYAEGFRGVVGGGLYGIVPVPETSDSYEAGFKFATPIDGLSGTASLYDMTRHNVITPDPVIPFASVQSGEQRARGIELDLIYEPDSSLSLLYSYGFTNAEVTADNSLPIGDRLRAVPEHSGRIAARYRFQVEALLGLEVGAGVTYTSSRELTLPNTIAADSLTLMDLQASYEFRFATASLSIVNVFDTTGFEPYQYFGGAYVVPVQPRAAWLTLRTRL